MGPSLPQKNLIGCVQTAPQSFVLSSLPRQTKMPHREPFVCQLHPSSLGCFPYPNHPIFTQHCPVHMDLSHLIFDQAVMELSAPGISCPPRQDTAQVDPKGWWVANLGLHGHHSRGNQRPLPYLSLSLGVPITLQTAWLFQYHLMLWWQCSELWLRGSWGRIQVQNDFTTPAWITALDARDTMLAMHHEVGITKESKEWIA